MIGSPNAGNLGALIVEVGTDLTDLDKGMKLADQRVQQFDQNGSKSLLNFKTVGIATAVAVSAAFVKLASDTFKYGQELHQVSVQTGMTAQEITRLRFIAGQTDASFEGLTSSIKFLSRSMYEASTGNAEFRNLFRKLGIDITDSQGRLRAASEILYEMGPALQRLGNETEMVAIGQKIMGRNFQENIGFFRTTKAELDKLRETNINTSEKMDEFATVVDKLSDRFGAWQEKMKNFLAEAGLPFLKWLNDVTDKQEEYNRKSLEAVRNSPDVQRFLAQQAASEAQYRQEQGLPAILQAPGMVGQPYGQEGRLGPQQGERPSLSGQAVNDSSLRAPSGYGQEQMQNPFEKMSKDMDDFNEKFFDVSATLSEGWSTLMTTFTTSFGTAFSNMIMGTQSFKEAVEQFWQSLASTILNLIGQMIAKWLLFQALKAFSGPFAAFLPFDQGGVSMRAGGAPAISAANGIAMTPSFGESGIPAVYHPNEIVSPIDKFFDFVKSVRGDTFQVYANPDMDARQLAQLVAIETDRRKRRPL